jgi:hypothetical protein
MIFFYRNYTDTEKPELKYSFTCEYEMSTNPLLVGQTFAIKYKIIPSGRYVMEAGDPESTNEILSLQKK